MPHLTHAYHRATVCRAQKLSLWISEARHAPSRPSAFLHARIGFSRPNDGNRRPTSTWAAWLKGIDVGSRLGRLGLWASSRTEIATICLRRRLGAAWAQCQTGQEAMAKLTHVGDQRHLIGERSPRRQASPRASSRTPSQNHINLLRTSLGFHAQSSLLDLPSQRDFPILRQCFWSDTPIEDTEGCHGRPWPTTKPRRGPFR